MKEISTQIGVDILGFPIYRILTFSKHKNLSSKFFKENKFQEKITISTIKQR